MRLMACVVCPLCIGFKCGVIYFTIVDMLRCVNYLGPLLDWHPRRLNYIPITPIAHTMCNFVFLFQQIKRAPSSEFSSYVFELS
jgi:hypothetical protein